MDCSKYLDFLISDCRPDCLHKCYAISSMDSTPETTPELKETSAVKRASTAGGPLTLFHFYCANAAVTSFSLWPLFLPFSLLPCLLTSWNLLP
jgi:hypothetical protein